MCLQGLREPPGSCKLLKSLLLGLWHGRGHPFDPIRSTDKATDLAEIAKSAPNHKKYSVSSAIRFDKLTLTLHPLEYVLRHSLSDSEEHRLPGSAPLSERG
jgi:hypothetical protein